MSHPQTAHASAQGRSEAPEPSETVNPPIAPSKRASGPANAIGEVGNNCPDSREIQRRFASKLPHSPRLTPLRPLLEIELDRWKDRFWMAIGAAAAEFILLAIVVYYWKP